MQSINTLKQYLIQFFQNMFHKLSSRTKNNHDRATEQKTPFSRITIHYFHSMNNTFTLSNLMSFICPTVSYFPQKARKIRTKITEKPAFLNVDARRPLRFARQYILKKSKDQKQGFDWCKISKFDTTRIPRCDWT